MSSVRRILIASVFVAAVVPAAANAQVIRADCASHVAAISRLSFAHEKHRLWYQRFWTGKCQGLSQSFLGDACSESEPGWNEAVSVLVRQAPKERQGEVLARACKLGELIGYEWAKDNNVRCIHTFGTNSLSTLNGLLKGTGDVFERVTRTEARARSMCSSLRAPMAKG
jgi:hypothetical protein